MAIGRLMLSRSCRFLIHFTVACLLVAGVITGVECILLNQEQANRSQLSTAHTGDAVILCSSSRHHTLRPGAVIEPENLNAPRLVLNSFGLRGPEPTLPKPANVYRVVVLGDETVFASHLGTPELATTYLQHHLQQLTSKQVEVVNAGIPGYCPLLSFLQFRHQLLGLNPDAVVLHYDLSDAKEDHRYRSTLQVDANGTPLACVHPAVLEGANSHPTGTVARFAIGRWLLHQVCDSPYRPESSFTDWPWPLSGDPERVKATLKSLEPIAQLSQFAKELSARFVLTSTPASMPQIASDEATQRMIEYWQKPRELLTTFAAENRIEFCDTSDALVNADIDQLYDENGLTRSGHYALATELAAHIANQRSRQATPGILRIQQVSGGG
ncbi:MAG: SGNH/GDSL hydrolase family protein [Planctomycetaceae bacterium]